MRTVKLALFGLGTVGSGLVSILEHHASDFEHHEAVSLEIAAVCTRTAQKAEALGLTDKLATIDEVMDDPDIDIVVELIGGTGFAHEVVLRALNSKKSVVTANKALMATCGQELFEAAEQNGVHLAFEGSVGGGIPIIAPLKHSLIGNEISSVLGIVNGTTNYMLTRMDEEGLSYDDALAEAQRLGFAEADPTADVDGFDAAAKIAILASIAFNSRVVLGDVTPEGIRAITPTDLAYARNMGYAIKLLAIANRTDDGIDVRVHPAMLPLSHPLARVDGVYNAIYVTGDAVGETMFFGEGAGSGPAASAVMGDIIETAKSIQSDVAPLVGCTCTDSLPIRPLDELVCQYYIRLSVADEPGVLAATSAVFATQGVSIYSMVQQGAAKKYAELVYVTHDAREADVKSALSQIEELDAVHGVEALIRLVS